MTAVEGGGGVEGAIPGEGVEEMIEILVGGEADLGEVAVVVGGHLLQGATEGPHRSAAVERVGEIRMVGGETSMFHLLGGHRLQDVVGG